MENSELPGLEKAFPLKTIHPSLPGDKLRVMVLYVLLVAVLIWGYRSFVVGEYGYMGFAWKPSLGKVLCMFFLVVSFALLAPSAYRRPSDFLVHFQFLFPVLPMLLLFSLADMDGKYMLMAFSSFAVIVFVVRFVPDLPAVRISKISPYAVAVILLFVSCGVVVSAWALGAWRYFNLDILRVYEFRGIVAEMLPRSLKYLFPLAGKILVPAAAVLLVCYAGKVHVVLPLAASVLIYGTFHHKGPLFYPFVSIGLLLLFSVRRNPIVIFLMLLLLVNACLLVGYVLDPSSEFFFLFNSLGIRRSVFVPAFLNFLYYDFFSAHGFVFWAPSKVSFGLVEYPYNLDTSHLIGEVYFGNPATGANTGWLGSGYMNAGFCGMIVYALIIGMLFRLLDAYGKGNGRRLIIPMASPVLFALCASSDLPAVFLTHGLLALLMLLSVVDFEGGKKRKNNVPGGASR